MDENLFTKNRACVQTDGFEIYALCSFSVVTYLSIIVLRYTTGMTLLKIKYIYIYIYIYIKNQRDATWQYVY